MNDTQRPLFGMPEPKPEYPERITVMWRLYGTYPGNICKYCAHLKKYSYRNEWYKCELSRYSGVPAAIGGRAGRHVASSRRGNDYESR